MFDFSRGRTLPDGIGTVEFIICIPFLFVVVARLLSSIIRSGSASNTEWDELLKRLLTICELATMMHATGLAKRELPCSQHPKLLLSHVRVHPVVLDAVAAPSASFSMVFRS